MRFLSIISGVFLLAFAHAAYAQLSLDAAKVKCVELGRKAGTEEFGKCVLQLSKVEEAKPAPQQVQPPVQTYTPPLGIYTPTVGQAGKNVVWVPSPMATVDAMLDLANLNKNDFLIDLGSGDGRIVLAAAKRGIRAHGIEYDSNLVEISKRSAATEGVSNLATFERADIFQTDFSRATVITLFLLPELNVKLSPEILKMKPGTRVISNSFTMGNWVPNQTLTATGNCANWCKAYLWVVPAR